MRNEEKDMDSSKFSKTVISMCSMVLDLPPCCIEFVPNEDRYFVVGTYDLQKEEDREGSNDLDALDLKGTEENADIDTAKPQSRSGSLILFSLEGSDLTLLNTLKHPSAILDLHFLPESEFFAAVDSTGCVSIYRVTILHIKEPAVERDLDAPSTGNIELITSHQVFAKNLLILSFNWFPKAPNDAPILPVIAVTLSDGSLHILRFEDWTFMRIEHLNDSESLHTHVIGPKYAEQTMQAWCCSWVSWGKANSNSTSTSILTGGDDAKIRHLNLSNPMPDQPGSILDFQENINAYQTAFQPHEYGVTAILPLPLPEKFSNMPPLLLTGGYDDQVKLHGPRDFPKSIAKPLKVLSELNIGGGVWKLKLVNHSFTSVGSVDFKYRVLASCMYAGARILEIKCTVDGKWLIKVVGAVTIHGSMCYGSEIQPQKEIEVSWNAKRVYVSTSFYDKLLCVWSFDPELYTKEEDGQAGIAS